MRPVMPIALSTFSMTGLVLCVASSSSRSTALYPGCRKRLPVAALAAMIKGNVADTL